MTLALNGNYSFDVAMSSWCNWSFSIFILFAGSKESIGEGNNKNSVNDEWAADKLNDIGARVTHTMQNGVREMTKSPFDGE